MNMTGEVYDLAAPPLPMAPAHMVRCVGGPLDGQSTRYRGSTITVQQGERFHRYVWSSRRGAYLHFEPAR